MNQVRGPAGTPVTKVAGTAHPVPRVRRLAWLPVLAYIVLIAILYTALSRNLAASLVFDPPVLMLVLNTVFLFGISLAVCTVAMRAYLASGSSNILLLGCGVLTLGCAALAGGWVRPLGGTANASVTIHNLCVLLASIVYAMSALLTLLKAEPEQIMEKRQQRVFFALAGTLILISIIIAGTLRGAVPLFWAADVGSTPIKHLVLGTAIVLFALTSINTMILYFQTSHYFLYWYSLALALTTIGLIGITVMKAVGDPIGWAGRTAQYLGGVYFLIAALSALRNAQRQGLTLEAAIDRFYRRSEVHYRDLIDTASDAIISIDDKKRVLLWNQGAEKMLGYTPNEAAGRLVADLVMPEGFGERLNEELQALQGEIRSPFAAKGLEIEMLRKDGTTFPSETALSMRRIGASWIATLVVRDITERKRSVEESQTLLADVQWEKERLSALINGIQDEVWFADTNKNFTLANPSALREFGFNDAKGIDVQKLAESLEIYRPDGTPRPVGEAPPLRALNGEVVRNQEEVVRTLATGEFRYRQVSAAPVRDARGDIMGSVSVVRDITDQKRAEEQVRTTLESIGDGFFACDRDWRFVYVNAPAERILGIRREEVLGKSHWEVFPLTLGTQLESEYRRAAAGETRDFENFYEPWGRWLHNRCFPREGGGMSVYFQDITQRKFNEERIARLTKLYSVLSRVNEMIVRTHDEGQLYAEVCRIVAEEGEFPLVWVGQVKDLQVTPAAWHGPAADYLKEIKVETEGELGSGPTGTCIREDRPVLNDDFQINALTAPWRKTALSHGFRASAAFPLHRQGSVIGSLTLYAPEANVFDLEHVKLLESLCADVSFALDAIQQEKLRKQAERTLRDSETRFKLLSETAVRLLATDNPQEIVNELCLDVMAHLDCQACFNFLVDDGAGRLHLNACAGIPEEEARKIEWLDYGVAVCGSVAQEGHPIVAEDILNTPDIRTELVKSYGIQAYACHPLMVQGRLIGTLSFGTKTRPNFSPEDIVLMRTVTDQVATAMERMRLIKELQRSRDELEIRIQQRTAELNTANKELREEVAGRKKAEQQLRQAQKMEAIGTLTGGIAHDLNNIFAPIIINSELALFDLPGGSRIHDNLDLIHKSGLRGKDLVRQLLLFSRQSEKKQELITLTSLVEETFKLLRASIPTTIEMNLRLETESDSLYADPSQIQQVIMNLCTNAAYAMRGKAGAIDLSLQSIIFDSNDLPEPDMQPGNYLVLSVKDTGCGMEEEVRKRIFEPFFSTKPSGEGTGLGLSVAYGISKNHKGNITVYSEPGKGSIFRVYLPKVDTGLSVTAEIIKPFPRGSERILFVDDEEFVVSSVRNMLQQLGYKVTTLTDSREALKLFLTDPSQFDLVMTDQTMPLMTGEDLGKEMMRIRSDIPVVLCTGYADFISSEKAAAMGFRGFIMKPFTVREGAELVRRVLDKKGTQ